MLLYCLLAGTLVYAIYHALLRAAFVEWAPQAIAARMPADLEWPPKDLAALWTVPASLLIGAASHLAWDAFTHANTAVVQHVGVLRAPVAVGGRVVPFFKILQHLSGLLGFLVLAGYAAGWYRRTDPAPMSGRRPDARQRHLVLTVLAAAMAAGGAAILLCLGWRIRYRGASKRAAKSTG